MPVDCRTAESRNGRNCELFRVARASLVVVATLLALAGVAFTAPTIGLTSATPSSVPAGTPTVVVFSAQIADPTVIATGVNLMKKNGSGVTLSTVGTMRGDRTNGVFSITYSTGRFHSRTFAMNI
jgi:hypothetical protein